MSAMTELRIDLQAIGFNLSQVRAKVGPRVEIMPVIKADAYGHGAVELAKYLVTQGIGIFGVARSFEAEALRLAGIKTRILVLQPDFHTEQDLYRQLELEALINDPFDLHVLRPESPLKVHLFADSGMGREGADLEAFKTCLEKLKNRPDLQLVGLGTHFASADDERMFAAEQLNRFKSALSLVPPEQRSKIHCANSGAIINLPEAHFDMVRVGIWLYGQYTGMGMFQQRPAMRVIGKIGLVKTLPAGHSVGYSRTFFCDAPTRVGLVSVGYADGYSRCKSGAAFAVHKGCALRILGRVSMDSIILELGEDGPDVGDEVLLLGGSSSEEVFYRGEKKTLSELGISIEGDAARQNTITYERCCQLGLRLPRVYL